MPSFHVEHLGCKVNQYEAEALHEGLERLGLRPCADGDGADLFVLNSCSVTHHAGATSRKLLRRFVRRNPAATVLVTGCYAVSDADALEQLGGVDRIFDNDHKEDVIPWVAANVLHLPPDHGLPPFRVTRMGRHTRAFVKVQDGCDDRCTFCIIPVLRGAARSRNEDAIVAEVHDLVAAGHLEVVLTGVHLGYYGKETGAPRRALVRLLERLVAVPGLRRLKLSSIEVHEVTGELLDLLAAHRICSPHFHLPLQSGSDAVLGRMRRKYNTRIFRERVDAIRERFDRPALATDVIVGFPGETEEEFTETLDLVRAVGFMKMHVFPYSVREGTAAAAFDGRLPDAVLTERKRRLLALDARLSDAYRRTFLGERHEVLVEGQRDGVAGQLTGLTDRYLRVLLEGPDRLQGSLVDVRLAEEGPDGTLRGSLLTREMVT